MMSLRRHNSSFLNCQNKILNILLLIVYILKDNSVSVFMEKQMKWVRVFVQRESVLSFTMQYYSSVSVQAGYL